MLKKSNNDKKTIFDPFMGSGTVLSEAVFRGVDFYGSDINPLSLLCCRVKSDNFNYDVASSQLSIIKKKLVSDSECCSLIEFEGSDKWFDLSTLRTLSKIANDISSINVRWCRRIFWLALAESVRKFSKTRISTYKLHIDKNYKIHTRDSIVNFFLRTCARNLSLKDGSWKEMVSNGAVIKGHLKSKVHLELSDIRCLDGDFKADMVVTSPPYGDNQTTVTYGQFSYLPLQFIDLDDIDHSFDRSLIRSISAIDSASLGGSMMYWKDKMQAVEPLSDTLRSTLFQLDKIGRGGEKRLASFSYDLWHSLISVSQRLKDGGYIMITLGNRTINGVSVPLDVVVEEILSSLGFLLVNRLRRDIKKKRMAGSMSSEKILVMKKTS